MFALLLLFASACPDPVARNCTTRIPFYPDEDGDGFGEPTSVFFGCEAPEGWVAMLAPTGGSGLTGTGDTAATDIGTTDIGTTDTTPTGETSSTADTGPGETGAETGLGTGGTGAPGTADTGP